MSENLRTAADLRARHERRAGGTLDESQRSELADDLEAEHERAGELLQEIDRAAGDRGLTASEQRRWDGIDAIRSDLAAECRSLREKVRTDRAGRIAERRARWGSTQIAFSDGRGPWDVDTRAESPAGWVSRAHDALAHRDTGVSNRGGEILAQALSQPGNAEAAKLIVARSNPAYASAFGKVLVNPERALLGLTGEEAAAFSLVESCRASMTTNVGTAGFVLPLSVDPNVSAVINDGASNPFRAKAQIRTSGGSPYRALTSPGITAEWTAENAVWADASPTFGKVDIPLYKLNAYVSASFELFADAGEFLSRELPILLADARNNAEAAAFATGNGTTAPKGIVTAVAAVAACTITATTRGSFTSASTADVFNLLNALPPRARQAASVGGFANVTHITTVRQMVAGTGGVPLVGMDAAIPQVLGVPLYESSSMSSAQTSGTTLAVVGDMSKYLIVDSVQGPTLEYVSVLLDQATGRPTGARGWMYWARVGADVLDPSQFRRLLA